MRAHTSAGSLIALFGLLTPVPSLAQPAQPDVAAPGAAPATSTTAVPGTPTPNPPPDETASPPAPAPVVPMMTPAPPAPEAAPVVEPKTLSTNVWTRIGGTLQSGAAREQLTDFAVAGEVNLLFSGQIHKYFGWQADFVGTFGNGTMAGQAQILDLIAKLDAADAFHVWFGRMLVPSDRSNFSGAWFMIPWNYPGFYPAAALGGAPLGPKQGPFGRNDGATVWGEFMGGHLKYYLGAFDMHDVALKPLFTGRLNISLLNPEPGYYHSSTYYGRKDIIALGLGVQSQAEGSVGTPATPGALGPVDDFSEVSVDLLAEKNFGEAGVVTLEGAFHKFTGDYNPAKTHFFALASYLLPQAIGIGRLQPMVRYQQAKSQADETWSLLDGFVSYVIDEYALRISGGYQYQKIGDTTGNAVQIGIQIQK